MHEDNRQSQKEENHGLKEPIPSIQLLSDHPVQNLGVNAFQKKDKKTGILQSINNFIQKTYAILQEKQFENIVSWSDNSEFPMASAVRLGEGQDENGNQVRRQNFPSSFKIHNLRAFEQIVLPKYFKHSNMSSFVRQLNMYNFHKVRGDRNEIEFQHEKFRKNRPDLLPEIKRKQVDSTTSIPSIAFLPQGFSQQQLRDPEVPPCEPKQLKREEPPLGYQQNESPVKRDSSEYRSFQPEQSRRLNELQEINRNLKKTKQMKLIQLRQLNFQNKNHMSDKFNKFIFAMIACKMQQDLGVNNRGSCLQQEANVDNIHKITDHIMDSTQPRPFQEYLSLTRSLLCKPDIL